MIVELQSLLQDIMRIRLDVFIIYGFPNIIANSSLATWLPNALTYLFRVVYKLDSPVALYFHHGSPSFGKDKIPAILQVCGVLKLRYTGKITSYSLPNTNKHCPPAIISLDTL